MYQEDNDERREIPGSFAIEAHDEIHFNIGAYDRSKPLIIDPALTFSTSFGGDGNDQANGIAVDSAGNTYIAGLTTSTNFPLVGPEQSTKGSTQEAFVAKMNAAGTALIYSTYLGGNADDNATSLAIDSTGNAYIAGWTKSTSNQTRIVSNNIQWRHVHHAAMY